MKSLTSGDLIEVLEPLGVTAKQFRGWCDRGLIAPEGGGGGKGDHRRFTLMQAVGVAVAAKVHASERGCVPEYLAAVVAAFAAVGEKWLLERFREGETHLVMVHHGRPLLRGRQYDWVDVRATYREVLATVARIERRPHRRTSGRSRGLAGTSKGK